MLLESENLKNKRKWLFRNKITFSRNWTFILLLIMGSSLMSAGCKIIKVFPGWVISYILIGKQELGTNWSILLSQITWILSFFQAFKLPTFFLRACQNESSCLCKANSGLPWNQVTIFINPLLFVHSLKLMRLWFVNCNIKNPV